MTEPMAVRKFVKRYCNKSIGPLENKIARRDREISFIKQQGYFVISNILKDIDPDWDYLDEVELYLLDFQNITLWCDQTFKPRHWTYIHDHWAFSHAADATLFRLTWL